MGSIAVVHRYVNTYHKSRIDQWRQAQFFLKAGVDSGIQRKIKERQNRYEFIAKRTGDKGWDSGALNAQL